ncbi:MAG: TlpA disulfide reductase family protein [Planctomycetia bacterium]|nr:TlpA disulfide reductase family protein [Planctomycetia bacterium]
MQRAVCFLALIILCVAPVRAQESFSWLEGKSPIYGTMVETNRLRGKVVLMIYWGINCPPCRAAMVKVRDAQAMYGPTQKFYVIGSHMQPPSDKVQEYLTSKQVNFPIFQSIMHPKAPVSGGIPHGVLIDKSGEVVATGHPVELLGKVPALIAQSPPPGIGGLSEYGLIGNPLSDVNLGEMKGLTGYFQPGRPWSAPYRKITAASKKKDADEFASTILSAIDSFILEEIRKQEELAKEKPAEAYASLSVLFRSAKGTPKGKDVQTLQKELGKDPNVKALATILLSITEFDTFSLEMDEKTREKKGNQLVNLLQKFLGKKDLDEKLRREAEAALEIVKQIAGAENQG